MRASQVKAQNNWVFLKLDPRRVKVGRTELPTQTGVERVGYSTWPLYTSDAADDLLCTDPGVCRIITTNT